MIAFTAAGLALLLLAGDPSAPAPDGRPQASVGYEFTLGDNRGEHASSFARIAFDRATSEVFVASGATVVIYKEGFETYRFRAAAEIGGIAGLAVLEEGDLLFLSSGGELFRCNYRGKLAGRVQPELPPVVGAFRPDQIRTSAGRVYLLDSAAMKVVVLDTQGRYVAFRDLGLLLIGPNRTDDHQIRGFGVDDHGNLLATIPPLFKAYIVSPGGEVTAFGSPGSREGRFNVVGAIARDERGIVYVADVLRAVIILFSPELEYIAEIGGQGYGPGQLITPSAVTVGGHWLFVSQGAERGVNAYRVF